MKIEELELLPVEYMPAVKEDGKLYFSVRFRLAIHNCACGCRTQTVTPLGDKNWIITIDTPTPESQPLVSLRPSILNPCKAHYHITNNKIEWL